MTYEHLFTVLSFAPGIVWMGLLFCVSSTIAMRITDGMLVLYSLIFSILVAPDIARLIPIIAEPEFEVLRTELHTPKGFVGTWTHMILGDLWIGRWVARDAFQLGDSAWLRAPFVLTIMFFGPLGFFVYWLYRMIRHRKLALS